MPSSPFFLVENDKVGSYDRQAIFSLQSSQDEVLHTDDSISSYFKSQLSGDYLQSISSFSSDATSSRLDIY